MVGQVGNNNVTQHSAGANVLNNNTNQTSVQTQVSQQAPQDQDYVLTLTAEEQSATNSAAAQTPPQTQPPTAPPPQASPRATSAQVGSSGASQVSGANQSGNMTYQDVLATLRNMLPGWTISTTTADWGEGFRNIQIDRNLLERMAADPAEMERVMGIIRDFEELVPQLEQWAEQNPGQSFIMSFMLDADGNVAGLATIRTLLGVDNVTSIDLTGDSTTWLDSMREAIEAMTQPQESRSWTA